MFCNCYEFYRNMYLNKAGKQRELRTERDPGHVRLKAAGCLIAEFPIQWRPRDPHAKCQKSQGKQASQSLGCIRMNKDHSIIKVPSQEPSGVPVALNYDWGFRSCNLLWQQWCFNHHGLCPHRPSTGKSVLHILQRIHQQLTWTSACLLHRNTWHFAAGPVPSNKNNTYLLLTIQLTVVRSLVLEVQTKFDGDQQEPLKLWCSIIQMVCVWCSLMFIVSSSVQDPWLVTSASVVLPEAHILSSPSYTPW